MNLKIFAQTVDDKAKGQIDTLMAQKAFCDCKVRIMPDVHAGAGCVIGFTADLGDKVIPNIVGVDIGCGMLTVPLGTGDIDYSKLDMCAYRDIPHGQAVHSSQKKMHYDEIEDLRCHEKLIGIERLHHSIGTLGGGNHFIEVDKDEEGKAYLVIHTGSRNLGKQVAEIYQEQAIEIHAPKFRTDVTELRKRLAMEGRSKRDIKDEVMRFTISTFEGIGIPRDLCYLEGTSREDYLHDMAICQRFAHDNRMAIARTICERMGWLEYLDNGEVFETVHNYIDHESNIVRKGAVRSLAGERLLIPMNMRDGCILGKGKGNEDWNMSAPHGAGRVLSRTRAKENISLEEYRASMEGIYTTSVSEKTIDESPMAYKDMSEILSELSPSVEVEKIIKSVYNFKAAE